MATPDPGELLRKARRRHGVSQKRLAIRAGTTQSAIERIERGHVSPSMETLRELLNLLGQELMFEAKERNSGIHRPPYVRILTLTPTQRLRRGLAFSDFVRRNRSKRARKRAA